MCVVTGGNDLVNSLSTEASRLRYFASSPEMSPLVPKPLFPQTQLCLPFVALAQCFGNIHWITNYSTVSDAPQAPEEDAQVSGGIRKAAQSRIYLVEGLSHRVRSAPLGRTCERTEGSVEPVSFCIAGLGN